jgi:hypothetical protein
MMSFTDDGFTGRGVITSVSSTPLGTVSSMRANKSAHVDAKRSGELANLSCGQRYSTSKNPLTHESMVAFPSLPKMRLSELVVSLNPTISGFFVVPAIYSAALHSGQGQFEFEEVNCTHTLLSKVTNVESKCATLSVLVGSFNTFTIFGKKLC